LKPANYSKPPAFKFKLPIQVLPQDAAVSTGDPRVRVDMMVFLSGWVPFQLLGD
jgi:hypothetical protein